MFLWSCGPRDHENQKNARAWDEDLTERPREDQTSRGVLVVSWTTRPREPKECLCLGRIFNQETKILVVFLWSHGPRDHENQKNDWAGLEIQPRDHKKTKILVVFLWSRGPRDHENQKNAWAVDQKIVRAWDEILTKRPREPKE